MRFAVSVAVVTSLICAERAAHACSAPICQPSWAAPDTGSSVPANAPAIYLQYGSAPLGGMTKPGTPRLTTKDGTAIPFTVDGSLLRPTAPMPVGDAILRFDEPCTSPPPEAGLPERAINFKVTASAPLPTKLGTIVATYEQGRATVTTSSGSCTDGVDAAIANLKLTLDPALEPYRSVLAFRTDVDGDYWGASVFGRDRPYAHSEFAGMAGGLHRHDRVFAACGPSPMGAPDRGVAPGKHKVSVTAIVAGAEPLPPVTFDIELTCSATPEPGLPETGTVDDASVDDAGVTDSGPLAATPDETSSGCGCVVAGAPRAGSWAALIALVLAFGRLLDTKRRPR